MSLGAAAAQSSSRGAGRDRHGRGGEEVAHLVESRQRQRDGVLLRRAFSRRSACPSPPARSLQPSRRLRRRTRTRESGPGAGRRSPRRGNRPRWPRRRRRASGPRGSRPWRQRPSSSEPRNSRCAAAIRVIAATSGSKARESREISPSALIPISPTIHSGLRGQVDDRHREPDRAVLVARRLLDGEAPGEDRGGELLRRRLSGRARDRRQAEARFVSSVAPANRRSASRGSGTSTTGKSAGRPAGRRSPSIARAPAARRPRAAKSWPSTLRSADRDEEFARPDPPRIHRDAREHRPRRRPGVSLAVDHAREPSNRVKFTAARELRGDVPVVEGQRPVPDDLRRLVPLAGDDHDGAGVGELDRRFGSPRAGRRSSGISSRPTPRGPFRPPRRIASGSSERGLSEVAIAMSARRPAISPIGRALAAVAVPAAAEDQDDLLVGQLPHRGEQPLQGVLRVRVVDEDRVGLARLDPLEPPGNARDAEPAPPRSRSGGIRSASPAARRREQVLDVEAPEQRRSDRKRSARVHGRRETCRRGRNGRRQRARRRRSPEAE